jgi:hypothetical protein
VLQPQEVTVVDSEEDLEIVAGEAAEAAEIEAVVVVVAVEAEARKRRTGFL